MFKTFKTSRVIINSECTSKFIMRFFIHYIFNKITPSLTLDLRVVRARILLFGLTFLSVAHVLPTIQPGQRSFNPLRPNSDLSQTSHWNIKGLSVSEVMRIENVITQVKFY